MTAEIAVMNRVAIALAADSAATSIDGGVAKIYQTTDKLFNLDTVSPIAVMVYGGSEFLSIPWETIVKLFRSRHSARRSSVRDYADAFLGFLSANELINDELALFMTKDLPHASSGFVLAGFGENELFPSLIEYDVEGVVYPRFLRLRLKSSAAITSQIGAHISPFAQAEMVHSFMTGVDPALRG